MIEKKNKRHVSTALLSFDSFFSQFSPKSFKKKSTIVTAGTTITDIYYLKKGYAKAYSVSADGEDLIMVIFQPGDFFPLISTIEPSRNEYYIDALTEVEIIQVPRTKFIELLRTREDLLVELILRLTSRFEGVLTRMEYLVFGSASQKLASIILILADRFGEKRANNMYVKVPLTHRDLASLVGITRETTTLILSEFTKKGILNLKSKHILINNQYALRKASLVI